MATRIDISLDEVHAERLRRVAGRLHVSSEELANLLISSALDAVETEPETIDALLDHIPGASARIAAGVADFHAGRTHPLDTL